ncbi:hypothetical protein ASA1KI_18020 [Opitutales bacterium ASA1]|nr:hypothetical protein ASA1KI_18020 [Opitutales bacterium ASA1]
MDGSGQRVDRFEAIEEEEQPMRTAFVGPFADHGEQVKTFGGQAEAGFLGGLASGAFVRGFAEVCLEFAADRAPKSGVGCLAALQKEVFAETISEEDEDGDLVFLGQRLHGSLAMEKPQRRQVSCPASRYRRDPLILFTGEAREAEIHFLMAALPNVSRLLATALLVIVALPVSYARNEDTIEVRSVSFGDLRAVGSRDSWLECRVELSVRTGLEGGFVSGVQVDVGMALRGGSEGFEFFGSSVRLVGLESGKPTVRFYLPPEVVARFRSGGEPFAWSVDVSAGGKEFATAVSRTLDSSDALRGFRERLGAAAVNVGILRPQHRSPFAHLYPSDTPTAVLQTD